MPYNKDKQQAFHAAQQGYRQAKDIDVVRSSANYGDELKHLKQEIDEANQQINNALEVASEHQRVELEKYQKDLNEMSKNVDGTF
jgi:50S ribosomal subunit-associated GTPase HflX